MVFFPWVLYSDTMLMRAENDTSDSGEALFPIEVYMQFPGLARKKPIYRLQEINIIYQICTVLKRVVSALFFSFSKCLLLASIDPT